jgi:hypothetical protein
MTQKMIKGGILHAVFGICLIIVVGCASSRTSKTDGLVGLWVEDSENVKAVILRKADGTYWEKKIQKYDVTKPVVSYVESGRWQLKGGRYWFAIDDVSAPLWKSYVGRTWSIEVLKIGGDLFRYVSTDGAVVEEKKVGDASEEAFAKANVEQTISQL